MAHTIVLRVYNLPDHTAEQIAAGYAAVDGGAVDISSLGVQGNSAGWIAAVHSVGELEQGLFCPRSTLHRWRRQLEYGSVSCGVLVLAAGGAVELICFVVPGESPDRIGAEVRAEGVNDAFGITGLGGSEHVNNSIAGGVAPAVSDAVDVSTRIEKQITVGITSGCGRGAERIQDRLNSQRGARGRDKLVQRALIERAADGRHAVQVSGGVQHDRPTRGAAVSE